MKAQKSIEKKRFSQTRQVPIYEYKVKNSTQEHYRDSNHIRSSSNAKNTKVRLKTDYEAYTYKNSQEKKLRKSLYPKQRK